MPDFDVSILICSWNTEDDLRLCLASLERERVLVNFEVLVVDNNSADGSPDMVAREFPWVELHRMPRNLGFTGGNNHALSHRRAAAAMLLNSDTIVHDGAIAKLVGFAEAHPEVGVIGPRLLNSDGSLQLSCRRFPNPIAALFRNTPLGRLFPKNRFTRDYLMQDFDHSETREVDWVSGAALYASGEMISRVGPLDPEYFMFCEDVDWCFQTWKLGLKVVYLPDAVITHAIGRSTDKAPNRMIGRFHRSMFRFFAKNMVPQINPLARPFALAFAASALFARASLFVVKNKIDVVKRWAKR